MDPITSAIIAALTAGATGGLTDTTKKLIADLYGSIKERIQQKHGKESKVAKAINDLESEPGFVPYQAGLHQRINESGIDRDPEIVGLANRLLSLIQQNQNGARQQNIQNVCGNGNVVAGPYGTAINLQRQPE